MKTLADLFFALDAQLGDDTKAQIAKVHENYLWKLHMGVSGLIKGLLFLRNPSEEGREYFQSLGHEEEVSELFGELYWRHLQALSFDQVDLSKILEARRYLLLRESRTLAKDLSRQYLDYRRRCFSIRESIAVVSSTPDGVTVHRM